MPNRISNDVATSERHKNWEFDSQHDLLVGVIGYDYGKDPVSQLPKILEDKKHLAATLRRFLGLKKDMIGLEIGSGCGFITELIAPFCKKLIACDISHSYIKEAQTRCSHLPNVEFQHIRSGSLDFIPDNSLDFIYSSACFIHLDFFSITQYLDAAARTLKPGGKICFDILDVNRTCFKNNDQFESSREWKLEDPTNLVALQFNSPKGILRYASDKGLYLRKGRYYKSSSTWLTLTKNKKNRLARGFFYPMELLLRLIV